MNPHLAIDMSFDAAKEFQKLHDRLDMRDDVLAMREDIASLRKELGTAYEVIDSLRGSLLGREVAHQALLQRLERIESDRYATNFNYAMLDLKQKEVRTIADNNSRCINGLHGTVEHTDAKVNADKIQIADIYDKLDRIDDKVELTGAIANSAAGQITHIHKTLEGVKSNISSNTTRSHRVAKMIDLLNESLVNRDAAIEKINKTLGSYCMKLESAYSSLYSLEDQLASNKNSTNDNANVINSLSKKVDDMRDDIDDHMALIDRQSERLDKVNATALENHDRLTYIIIKDEERPNLDADTVRDLVNEAIDDNDLIATLDHDFDNMRCKVAAIENNCIYDDNLYNKLAESEIISELQTSVEKLRDIHESDSDQLEESFNAVHRRFEGVEDELQSIRADFVSHVENEIVHNDPLTC